MIKVGDRVIAYYWSSYLGEVELYFGKISKIYKDTNVPTIVNRMAEVAVENSSKGTLICHNHEISKLTTLCA